MKFLECVYVREGPPEWWKELRLEYTGTGPAIDLKSLRKFSGDSDWSGDEEDITERLKKKEGKSNIIVVVQCTVY